MVINNQIISTNPQDISETTEKAYRLHREIMLNGELAANAFVEFCKGLKQMRDEKLYTELGFDTFDQYVEGAVGLKTRQAYTYISTFEKLGTSFLQSNANYGISKLELLAAVPVTERDEFIVQHNIDEMTVKQLKELTDKYNQAQEQMSLLSLEKDSLQEELNDIKAQGGNAGELSSKIEQLEKQLQKTTIEAKTAQAEKDKLTEKISKLEKKVKTLESKPVEVAVTEPTPEQIEKIKTEAQVEAEKIFDEKIRFAQTQAAQAAQRASELEKKLQIAGNSATQKAAIYFEELQSIFNKLDSSINEIASTDSETAEKLKAAVKIKLSAVISAL